ncbi:MAG: restriction endonuclease subunit S [Finegoldia magna]|uniref:restriction endonuclease subunit S n=1 Tax=Finegoldia magna TaxID=1260 RepID=UPI0029097129|nr:restriction endonuclease subunit S [Finegoldia magna]MDU5960973.1 restriction endonuclease subunit S [Finegoldia magna]
MEFKFSDAITINPSEKIKKGELIKKISMQNIKERNRNILDYEIAPYSSGSKFRNKDTLFARITPCLENGKTAQVNILNDDEIAFGSTEFIVFRARTGITIPDYVYFLSISECIRQQAIKSMTGTSGRQRVQNSIFDEITIEVPSIKEQEKIVGILNSLDSKIEINNKIISNLESQAQAIFKSWFVDFEPFQDGDFVESELGMIPEGWEVKELGEFIPVKTGKKNANIAKDNGEYPFFTCSQDISFTDVYSFDANAILLAGNGDFNVKRYNGKFEAYQRTYVLIPHQEVQVGWIYNLIKYNLPKIVSGYKGSVINYLTKGMIENFKIAVPNDINDLMILKNFNEIEVLISNLNSQNTKLAELRDALLPKLMAGEIDVSNIKIEGEEVKNE